MLRNIFLASLLILALVNISAQATAAQEDYIMPASDDRWVPWPWTLAQPFPWADIQGLWKVETQDYSSYFSLKVIREKNSAVTQLQVRQYESDSCRMIAIGVGLERNQRVLAQMTGKNGVTYRVQFTAFSEKDSPMPPLRSNVPTQGVMVLSMGALEKVGVEEMVHSQIRKISPYISQRVCQAEIKK